MMSTGYPAASSPRPQLSSVADAPLQLMSAVPLPTATPPQASTPLLSLVQPISGSSRAQAPPNVSRQPSRPLPGKSVGAQMREAMVTPRITANRGVSTTPIQARASQVLGLQHGSLMSPRMQFQGSLAAPPPFAGSAMRALSPQALSPRSPLGVGFPGSLAMGSGLGRNMPTLPPALGREQLITGSQAPAASIRGASPEQRWRATRDQASQNLDGARQRVPVPNNRPTDVPVEWTEGEDWRLGLMMQACLEAGDTVVGV